MFDALFRIWMLDKEFVETLISLGKFLFSVIAGITAGVWALSRWLAEQKRYREERQQQESDRLVQQRLEEENRRAERASRLMSDFGKANTAHAKLSTAMALALYPKHSTPLLVRSLGYLSEETVGGVEISLEAIGYPALKELGRMNVIARKYCEQQKPARETDTPVSFNANKLLNRSKCLITRIIKCHVSEELSDFDMSEVDLSDMDFQDLRFKGAYFRKTILDRANFSNATLSAAKFRGALLNETYFYRTQLISTDFTGAVGKPIMIRAKGMKAIFDHVQFAGGRFAGTDLSDSTCTNANFSNASLEGVTLDGANLVESQFGQIRASKASMIGVKIKKSELRQIIINESDLSDIISNDSKYNAAVFKNTKIIGGLFRDCDFGGAEFKSCDLSRIKFINCNLGGAKFESCTLNHSLISDCQLSSAQFIDSSFAEATFNGKNAWHHENTIFNNCNLETAVFDENNTEFKNWLVQTSEK